MVPREKQKSYQLPTVPNTRWVNRQLCWCWAKCLSDFRLRTHALKTGPSREHIMVTSFSATCDNTWSTWIIESVRLNHYTTNKKITATEWCTSVPPKSDYMNCFDSYKINQVHLNLQSLSMSNLWMYIISDVSEGTNLNSNFIRLNIERMVTLFPFPEFPAFRRYLANISDNGCFATLSFGLSFRSNCSLVCLACISSAKRLRLACFSLTWSLYTSLLSSDISSVQTYFIASGLRPSNDLRAHTGNYCTTVHAVTVNCQQHLSQQRVSGGIGCNIDNQ